MPRYEYKVVPAPTKGLKAKGVKGPEARFSNAIEDMMNTLATEGWEYQRAETLPSFERSGLTGTTTEWRNLLVFRRLRENDAEAFKPELLPPPDPASDPFPAVPKAPAAVRPIAAAKDGAETRVEPQASTTRTVPVVAEEDQQDTPDAGSIGSTIKRFASTRNDAKTDT